MENGDAANRERGDKGGFRGEEVSCEFKTLINPDDLDSLKQLQHLMYISFFLSFSWLDNMLFM